MTEIKPAEPNTILGIDVDAYYDRASQMVVRLAEDPVAAGGKVYINKMLKDIRDMSEELSSMLMRTKRALTSQMNVNERAKTLYRATQRQLLIALKPVERRGKSMLEVESTVKENPGLVLLEKTITDGVEVESVLRTLVEVLDSKFGDVKRANSDIRLQMSTIQAVVSQSGVPSANLSGWAKQNPSPSPEKLGGQEVGIDDL